MGWVVGGYPADDRLLQPAPTTHPAMRTLTGMTPQVRWHLFPADVQHGGQAWHEVLVQLTDAGVAYVWTYNPVTRDPVQLLTAPVTAGLDDHPLPSPFGPGYLIDETWNTAAGPVKVTKASGCGCRNPLRDANPLAGAL